jgi:hypothetical protein
MGFDSHPFENLIATIQKIWYACLQLIFKITALKLDGLENDEIRIYLKKFSLTTYSNI